MEGMVSWTEMTNGLGGFQLWDLRGLAIYLLGKNSEYPSEMFIPVPFFNNICCTLYQYSWSVKLKINGNECICYSNQIICFEKLMYQGVWKTTMTLVCITEIKGDGSSIGNTSKCKSWEISFISQPFLSWPIILWFFHKAMLCITSEKDQANELHVVHEFARYAFKLSFRWMSYVPTPRLWTPLRHEEYIIHK